MRILLTGPDLPLLITLAVKLDPAAYAIDIAEVEHPLETRRQLTPDVAVIWLTGSETVTQLQAFFEAHPETRCFFIPAEPGLPEAMTSLIALHDAVVVSPREAGVFVPATLIAIHAGSASAATEP